MDCVLRPYLILTRPSLDLANARNVTSAAHIRVCLKSRSVVLGSKVELSTLTTLIIA